MGDRAFGLYFLFLGVLLMLPSTGRAMRRWRDWQLRLMPWLRKFPGAWLFTDDRAEKVFRTIIAGLFAVVGLLAALGLIDLSLEG